MSRVGRFLAREANMALDHDVILVENFRESLDLYQRSLVWAMTASPQFDEGAP